MQINDDLNTKKLTKEEIKKLEDLVYSYPTRFKEGFIWEEQNFLLEGLKTLGYSEINIDKFNDALTGITCTMNEGHLTVYHCDILQAIICGIENRNQTIEEWD